MRAIFRKSTDLLKYVSAGKYHTPFYHKDQNYHSSAIGGILTILYLIFIVVYAVIVLSDTFRLQNWQLDSNLKKLQAISGQIFEKEGLCKGACLDFTVQEFIDIFSDYRLVFWQDPELGCGTSSILFTFATNPIQRIPFKPINDICEFRIRDIKQELFSPDYTTYFQMNENFIYPSGPEYNNDDNLSYDTDEVILSSSIEILIYFDLQVYNETSKRAFKREMNRYSATQFGKLLHFDTFSIGGDQMLNERIVLEEYSSWDSTLPRQIFEREGQIKKVKYANVLGYPQSQYGGPDFIRVDFDFQRLALSIQRSPDSILTAIAKIGGIFALFRFFQLFQGYNRGKFEASIEKSLTQNTQQQEKPLEINGTDIEQSLIQKEGEKQIAYKEIFTFENFANLIIENHRLKKQATKFEKLLEDLESKKVH
ncbi:hypothetical protein FGO68_gene17090 [Halteria grandinella]|uniref:Transmembrane protein n=1 Tax=Halteria grandinella TaxID=5974 RepID=A0A8J8NN56_HALGN|nr:hypothetical protein FGO68_gene17090 [Halteria grandinella]